MSQTSDAVTSDAVLARLMALHPKVIDLTLSRVYRLLAKLGNPHHRLPPVVHFAGTNGKGSTLAYMRTALEAAGYSVHAYTSPHLVRFHERIRLSGKLIDEQALMALLERVEEVNAGEPITYFEITTVAALLAFSEQPADILLLETGLGGRLDATNVVDQPRLSVITPISMDHEAFLGTTLAAIAGEKAGIIKPGCPVCLAPQDPEALGVLLETADVRQARCRALGENLPWGSLDLRFYLAPNEYSAPAMAGPHQVVNAATAMAALDMLEPDFQVPVTAREKALAQTMWAGRLQALPQAPWARGFDLWVDGGHNPAAGQALADYLDASGVRPHIVLGMLNTKVASGYLAPLKGRIASMTCVTIPNEPNAFPAEELARQAQALGIAARIADSPRQALSAFDDSGATVLVCGSLYLVGWLMRQQELWLS